jgi:hypothetical protein
MHLLHFSFLSKQDYGYVSNKGSHFHMVGPTHRFPNSFGASGSGYLPPSTATAHDTVGGIHGHPDRGVALDPADAATDRPAAEPEATSWC